MGVAFDPENLLSLTNQDITSEEITITPDLFGYLSYQKGKGKNSNSAYHTIQNGETISSIARKYNTSVNQICVINGIRPNTIIRAGKTIRVR
jgi:LysM repeat protein